MKKIILLLVAVVSLSTTAQESTETKTVTIPEGSIIKISLDKDISGKEVNAGDQINFTSVNDIIIDGFVVIASGKKVVGTVTEAAKSKGLGKKGKLSFSIDYLYLDNGKVIKLRNEVSKNLNGSGGVVVATSVLLTPLALFIKGKNAKYPKGTQFEAFVNENTNL